MSKLTPLENLNFEQPIRSLKPSHLIIFILAKREWGLVDISGDNVKHFLSNCEVALPWTPPQGAFKSFWAPLVPFPFWFSAMNDVGFIWAYFFFCSSGETVTSVTSLAPLQPQKGKRQKEKADVPPAVPAKGKNRTCSFSRESHLDWCRGGPGVKCGVRAGE